MEKVPKSCSGITECFRILFQNYEALWNIGKFWFTEKSFQNFPGKLVPEKRLKLMLKINPVSDTIDII